MMGQSVNRTKKRHVKVEYQGRVAREYYECSACKTTVQMKDKFCRNCGMDIREIAE